MIQTKLLFASDLVIVDGQSNSVSAIIIIDEIRALVYPGLMPRLALVAFVERDPTADPAEATGHLTVVLDTDTIHEQDVTVHWAPGTVLNRLFLRFQGFVVPRPGRIHIRLQFGEHLAESYSLVAHPPPQRPPEVGVVPPTNPADRE